MRRLALVCLMSAVAGLAAGPAVRAQEGDVERGHALVARNCAMCHAVGTDGDSANPAAPPFRELHRRYPIENLAEALAEGILTGHPQMPEFVFAPDEIQDIIRYLDSIQTRKDAALAPSRGRSE